MILSADMQVRKYILKPEKDSFLLYFKQAQSKHALLAQIGSFCTHPDASFDFICRHALHYQACEPICCRAQQHLDSSRNGTDAVSSSGEASSSSESSLDSEDDAELVGYREALHNLEQQRDAVSGVFLLYVLHVLLG